MVDLSDTIEYVDQYVYQILNDKLWAIIEIETLTDATACDALISSTLNTTK